MAGRLLLHLHAHLPWVRHPEHEHFLEEDWLFEAITETYLPLLNAFGRLAADGVPVRASMTLSPTLLSMLRDELLIARYERHLEGLIALGDAELVRTRGRPAEQRLARFYGEHARACREQFVGTHRRDLVSAFAALEDAGVLELITCAATHGFLPNLWTQREAVRAQLAVGCATHRRLLGRDPRGIWLPECGYVPGLDALLAEQGLRYFFVDGHGVADATPRPRLGPYAPIYTPSGVAAFGRDAESSEQVWSGVIGYPGDPVYREFYRDLGFDLPLEQVRRWVQPDGARKNTGFKYHRITGKGSFKAFYEPDVAFARAEQHAVHFVGSRLGQLERIEPFLAGRTATIVAPYDAELFGHWWLEGPHFLEHVVRNVARTGGALRLATASDVLREEPAQATAQPPLCSWGAGGYAGVWLDPRNDRVLPPLRKAAERLIATVGRGAVDEPLARRALAQAGRELLLAQSSDWSFILTTGTATGYAKSRLLDHLTAFHGLLDALAAGTVEESMVAAREARTPIFPDLDPSLWRPGSPASSGA